MTDSKLISTHKKMVSETESLPDKAMYERLRWSDDRLLRLVHAAMGIQTEAGEFADPIKKHLFYDRELDVPNLMEELGDLIWYIQVACMALDLPLEHVMSANIAKLRARYPGGFTKGAAIDRDLESEADAMRQITSAGVPYDCESPTGTTLACKDCGPKCPEYRAGFEAGARSVSK